MLTQKSITVLMTSPQFIDLLPAVELLTDDLIFIDSQTLQPRVEGHFISSPEG